ncbi:MAG: sigma-70 family RNA polymerase sigma factor [Saprospiraceae bacterium]|nr:sigma-70 family RNA polymerase sigma factor [Saprospiraceae bacterium]
MLDTEQLNDLLATYRASRDIQILGQIYKPFLPRVFRLCMHYLKHEQDSEDAAVDIFLELRGKLLKHEVQHFPAWLHTLARNHCLKKLRGKGRILLTSTFSDPERVESQPETDHLDEYLERLPDVIEMLEDRQRRCIVLFYLQGRSYKEIASLTGYSAMEVKSGIQNGRIKLKKMLDSHAR